METARKARGLVRDLKKRLETERDPAARLGLLLRLGGELWMANPDAARPVLEDALATARKLDDPRTQATPASMLAELARRSGDFATSERLTQLVLDVGRDTGDPRTLASGENLAGLLHQAQGRLDEARQCYERCLALAEESGFTRAQYSALTQLGSVHGMQGRLEQALDCYRRCLRLDPELDDPHGQASTLCNIGWALEQMGHWEDATLNIYRAIALAEQHGLRDLWLDAMNLLGEVFLKRDRLERAREVFATVIETARGAGSYQQALLDSLSNLGLARYRAGDYAAAEQSYSQAAGIAAEADDKHTLAAVACRRAELAVAEGRLADASDLLDRAESLARELGNTRKHGEVLRVRAQLHLARDEDGDARRMFAQSVEEFRKLGENYELVQVRLAYGRWLVDAGPREEAERQLRAAARTASRLSLLGEAEKANRMLYRLEAAHDPDSALVEGVKGLVKSGLEPVAFFDQALHLLTQGLGFGSGVVFAGERPAVLHGSPDVEACGATVPWQKLVSTGTRITVPVGRAGRFLGAVCLERPDPGPQPDTELLNALARVLAGPLDKLSCLPIFSGEGLVVIPGLQYRGVVGSNPQVLRSLRMVSRLADRSIPVLITGESGTGKELIARALHDSGSRRDAPFVAINCAAVPETLLEAEFFGIEKGTATGVTERQGKVEAADGGTIFLDEIGDMSPALQAKLLRVLDDHSFERVGGREPIEVDVRFVAATNRNLRRLISEGRFRQELYYRLDSMVLELPPLCERREDIPSLVRFFITRANQEYDLEVTGADEAVMTAFMTFDWPGNVRQLRHVVDRMATLAGGPVLKAEDLPPELVRVLEPRTESPAASLRQVRREARESADSGATRSRLLAVLEKNNWNVTNAAREAGYSRSHFHALLKKQGIHRPHSGHRAVS